MLPLLRAERVDWREVGGAGQLRADRDRAGFVGGIVINLAAMPTQMDYQMSIEWPKHAASMHLTHNQHKSYYKTVQQEIDDEGHGYTEDCWVSPEQRQKAIDTNECWILQWYPNTPIGFCILSGADLDVLIVAANTP